MKIRMDVENPSWENVLVGDTATVVHKETGSSVTGLVSWVYLTTPDPGVTLRIPVGGFGIQILDSMGWAIEKISRDTEVEPGYYAFKTEYGDVLAEVPYRISADGAVWDLRQPPEELPSKSELEFDVRDLIKLIQRGNIVKVKLVEE